MKSVKSNATLHFVFCSLYREERSDGSSSGVKWSAPNIHDLMKILNKIKVDLILDNVLDKRLTKIEKLPVVQLREECVGLNLHKTGKKVILYLIIRHKSLIFCFRTKIMEQCS